MKKLTKLLLCLSLAVVLAAPLSGCNTVAGIGKDTRAAGNAIEHASGQ